MTLEAGARETLAKWHRMVQAGDLSGVAALCAPDAVFRSPVAHTPYRGVDLVAAFLQQAVHAFSDFRYHRTFTSGGRDVVLEFSATVAGKELKGIDMIRFDEAGRILDFEVMVRPASGLQANCSHKWFFRPSGKSDGRGVQPDVAVPVGRALEAAKKAAIAGPLPDPPDAAERAPIAD